MFLKFCWCANNQTASLGVEAFQGLPGFLKARGGNGRSVAIEKASRLS